LTGPRCGRDATAELISKSKVCSIASVLSSIYEEVAMKSVALALAAASALSMSFAAFAQTDATPTRAQVRAEMQQLEQAGYDPARADDATYPSDIQAAEARISTPAGTAYGGVPADASTSGSRVVVRPASAEEMKQLYFGGQ
jgi:hypothetical protein